MKSALLLKTLVLSLFFLGVEGVNAQPAERKITRSEYIKEWSAEAVRQMQEYGIPASITLAQGILESGDGNSALARYANNHFGIKCHGWEGPGFYIDDDAPDECFRKYESAGLSYKDHSLFLKTRGRYSFLFDLNTKDYKGWAKGLKKAGYATNPKYPQLLIKIIEDQKLYEFDKMEKMPETLPETEPEDVYLLAEVNHNISISNNSIKSVLVKKGDTFFKLAEEFEMGLWQLYKYNDLEKGASLAVGDVVYLQPKRNTSKSAVLHEVRKGESMHAISQRYGIKLSRLYKLNNMRIGSQPYEGQQLSLKKQQ